MKTITKKLWIDDKWKETAFYSIPPSSKARDWLIEHYGSPKYPTKYWKTFEGFYLREDIYTHYKLCE